MRDRRGTVNSQRPGANMNPNDKDSLKDINVVSGKPFSQMSGGEKAQHIGKVFIFIITAGFAFPTILTE
jgi:hypothetical protein